MDEITFKAHLLAGKAYGREATCGRPDKPKQAWISEERADAVLQKVQAKANKPLEAYPCFWCGKWHLGRKMTPEEMAPFLQFSQEVTGVN